MMPKPTSTARKIEKAQRRKLAKNLEESAKREVRRRDRGCRFPLCGCRRLGLQLMTQPEVSHDRHKGMGGNPAGDRSTPEGLIQLCKHRHQDAPISRHKGTLRIVAINKRLGFKGPVRFDVDVSVWSRRASPDFLRPHWRTVAREDAPGHIGVLSEWQQRTLERLAEMEL